MFGSLGAPELILIFIVALLVFGPKRLPEIGRKVGGIMRDLRRTTGDFRTSVEREIGLDPASTGVDEVRKARRDLLSAVSDPLRDAASGAMGAARDVRDAVILPPGREGAAHGEVTPGEAAADALPRAAPAGAVPGPAPAAAGSSSSAPSERPERAGGTTPGGVPSPSAPPPSSGEPEE